MRKIILMIASGVFLSGCITPEQVAENAELNAQADSVRYISPEEAKTCTYIDQVSVIAGLSFFGGMEATEANARQRMKVAALREGADAVRIADRLLDKGRGGADQTRLTLYGDIYKCG